MYLHVHDTMNIGTLSVTWNLTLKLQSDKTMWARLGFNAIQYEI